MKIEIRKTCKICGHPLGYRQRTFCSKTCRNKNNYQKHKITQAEWQRRRDDTLAEIPSTAKVQCLICGRYYIQLGTHIVQRHHMTAREYREYFDLEVKKGLTPEWFHKLKGDITIENNTYKNIIETGKKYRFTKGSKNAGNYKRSHITLKKLSTLHKLTKRYIKKNT